MRMFPEGGVSIDLELKLTKFGRRFFLRMFDTRPPYKRNKSRGYGR